MVEWKISSFGAAGAFAFAALGMIIGLLINSHATYEAAAPPFGTVEVTVRSFDIQQCMLGGCTTVSPEDCPLLSVAITASSLAIATTVVAIAAAALFALPTFMPALISNKIVKFAQMGAVATAAACSVAAAVMSCIVKDQSCNSKELDMSLGASAYLYIVGAVGALGGSGAAALAWKSWPNQQQETQSQGQQMKPMQHQQQQQQQGPVSAMMMTRTAPPQQYVFQEANQIQSLQQPLTAKTNDNDDELL